MLNSTKERFLKSAIAAMKSEQVFDSLYLVALQMRISEDPISQDEAYQIIHEAKTEVTGTTQFGDSDLDNEICNVLDGVCGWCHASCHIWNSGFDAKAKLADLS